jgi:hypothetical protein
MPPRSRRRRLTLLAALPVMLGGCLSEPMSKKDAGILIQASTAFTRPKFAHIPRQITFQGYFSSPYGTEGVLPLTDLAKIDPTVAILRVQRAIDVTESIYGPGRGALHLLVVKPTGLDSASLLADEDPRAGGLEQQENYDAQEERAPVGYASWNSVKKELGWRVAIGTRQFMQVDQIHNWKDANENIPVNELAVDFSWHWVPNAVGDIFDSQSESFQSLPNEVQQVAATWGVRMNTAGPMQSRAYFQRIGSRWQLRVIQWSFGRGNPR